MGYLEKAFLNVAKAFSNERLKGISYGPITSIGSHFSFSKYNDGKIIQQSYLDNDEVYSIISKSAKTMANNIIWRVYQVNSKGEKEEVFNTPLNELLERPNRYQTQSEFREQAYTFLMTSGKSFIGGLMALGFKDYSSLHNLPSQITTFEIGSLAEPIKKYNVNWDLKREWEAEDVLFTKYISVDPNDFFNGLSPLRPGHKLLESSNNLITADAATMKNRGAAGVLTNRSDETMLPDEKKQVQKQLDAQLGGADKFNKIIATAANVDYVQLGMSPRDLELLKNGIEKRRRMNNVYGLDSSLFNDPANKTYSNRKDAVKDAYRGVYIPTDEKFIQGLNMWLSPGFIQPNGDRLVIEQDTSEIEALQEDKAKVTEIKTKTSEEMRAVIDDYNDGNLTREGAILMVTKLGLNKDEAEIVIQPTQNNNEGN